MRGAILPVTFAVLLTGCFRLSWPAPVVRTYRLDYAAPSLEKPPLPVVVRFAPIGVSAIYDREAIVYRESAYSIGTYFYHRWIANPSNMIADLLARDFAASGNYSAVQHGSTAVVSDYDITAHIQNFEELVDGGCRARIRVRVLVARTFGPAKERIRLRKTYENERPCSEDTTEDFVRAMSEAVAEVSRQLQEDVYAVVEKDYAGSSRR